MEKKDLSNNQSPSFKSGFVAITGRPNVGKSTLLNTFLGRKISIVSPKPQTTRDKISGILTTDGYQIIFEDTPGINNKKDGLSKHMQKCINAALSGGDIILLVVDAFKGLSQTEEEILDRYGKSQNFICAVNKTDVAKADKVMPLLSQLSQKTSGDIIPISALGGENIDVLLDKIISILPAGSRFYSQDIITDKNHRFLSAEIIREKILLYYQQEIPHGAGIAITQFEYSEQKQLTEIYAEIYCEKQSHKKIIIGKGGLSLKKTASSARKDIEELLGGKVFLSLWIKVKPNWKESLSSLKQLGYY
ncbi:MAG: GTPase Era [Clostridia bacterium]|nr:GTPase Era [Clostridia bacterium]